MRIVLNPSASRDEYTAREKVVISRLLAQDARCEISTWPEYAPTPLRRLDGVAARLGIGALYYQDESDRLGLGLQADSRVLVFGTEQGSSAP